MFKKLIQSISKSRTTQAEATKEAPPPIKKPQAAPASPAKVKDMPIAPPPPPAPVAKKLEPVSVATPTAVVANGVADVAAAQPAASVAQAKAPVMEEAKPVVKKSVEELCGVEPKMTKDQIRERIKLIYRRYNRAASSLDAATRAEAEIMLDAVVALREKTFGEI
jgi:hypothetical protein